MPKILEYAAECLICGYEGLYTPISKKRSDSPGSKRKYMCPGCGQVVEPESRSE